MATDTLDILFRDGHYLAVNKPSGMLVHRSDLDRHETCFALQIARDMIGQHVFPVHRLDRPTSGVLLFGLSPEAAGRAAAAFAADAVEKTYLAVVRGIVPAAQTIDYPLRLVPDRYERPNESAGDVFQRAVTSYGRLAVAELPFASGQFATSRYSLLRVSLLTGRRHQIRRHLKHVFHPVIGDTTYGDGRHNRLFRQELACSRLLLHARELSFTHPWSGESLNISAPLDEEFAGVMTRLGWAGKQFTFLPVPSPAVS